jgi:hypothetical protein
MKDNPMLRALTVIAIILCVGLAGCDATEQPPAEVGGGGFIFNYRLGEAYYGIVINAPRGLPEGSAIESSFDNPAGGAAIVISQKGQAGQRRYVFRTPAVKNVKKDIPYRVVVRIVGADGNELQRLESSFKSDFDQDIIGGGPLVVGPGYTPNPDNDITKPSPN